MMNYIVAFVVIAFVIMIRCIWTELQKHMYKFWGKLLCNIEMTIYFVNGIY